MSANAFDGWPSAISFLASSTTAAAAERATADNDIASKIFLKPIVCPKIIPKISKFSPKDKKISSPTPRNRKFFTIFVA